MSLHPPAHLPVGPDLLLRWDEPSDASLLASAVAGALDHLRPWMPWATPEAATEQAQAARLAELEDKRRAGTDYAYVLLPAEGGGLLGVVGLHRRVGPEAIELGYWLMPAATGRGLMTRAVQALTVAALALDDVSRVEIHCDVANARSAAVAERAGYRLDRVEDKEAAAPAETGRSMIWLRT